MATRTEKVLDIHFWRNSDKIYKTYLTYIYYPTYNAVNETKVNETKTTADDIDLQ